MIMDAKGSWIINAFCSLLSLHRITTVPNLYTHHKYAYYKLLIAQYMYPMLLHNVASGVHVYTWADPPTML